MPDPIVREIEAPAMDPGAPLPSVVATEEALSLSYGGPDRGRLRIVFTDPLVHYFGPPNDESLHGHPLAKFGLGHYRAFEVRHSRWVEELRTMNRVHPHHDDALFDGLQHFIWTFHDSTFECLASGFVIE
jgi:hypothetical protein